MKIPKGFDMGEDIDPNDYVLQIHRNVYGKKDSGRVWNQYLTKCQKCGHLGSHENLKYGNGEIGGSPKNLKLKLDKLIE